MPRKATITPKIATVAIRLPRAPVRKLFRRSQPEVAARLRAAMPSIHCLFR
jgi:hypothetical protein